MKKFFLIVLKALLVIGLLILGITLVKTGYTLRHVEHVVSLVCYSSGAGFIMCSGCLAFNID